MNNDLETNILVLSRTIQKLDYIDGMFVTKFPNNKVIINLIVNKVIDLKDLENIIHSLELKDIDYYYHIFYSLENNFNNFDLNNLTDIQIFFIELLSLSEIYIDKSNILYKYKENINEEYKKLK